MIAPRFARPASKNELSFWCLFDAKHDTKHKQEQVDFSLVQITVPYRAPLCAEWLLNESLSALNDTNDEIRARWHTDLKSGHDGTLTSQHNRVERE